MGGAAGVIIDGGGVGEAILDIDGAIIGGAAGFIIGGAGDIMGGAAGVIMGGAAGVIMGGCSTMLPLASWLTLPRDIVLDDCRDRLATLDR